jgi:hypothetical protein
MKNFLFIFLISIAFNCSSEEFVYKFYWLNIPVSEFSLKSNDMLDKTSMSGIHGYSIKTVGPMSLYREYSSSGKIILNNDLGWEYYLLGSDRGLPEEKHISYFNDKSPVINKFIDDKNQKPLMLPTNQELGLIDPFSILLLTIKKLKNNNDCTDILNIYDGKRKYKIAVNYVREELLEEKGKNKFTGETVICSFKIVDYPKEFNLSDNSKDKHQKEKVWPFKRDKKLLNVWFGKNIDFVPVKLELNTPIGLIVGNLIIQ